MGDRSRGGRTGRDHWSARRPPVLVQTALLECHSSNSPTAVSETFDCRAAPLSGGGLGGCAARLVRPSASRCSDNAELLGGLVARQVSREEVGTAGLRISSVSQIRQGVRGGRLAREQTALDAELACCLDGVELARRTGCRSCGDRGAFARPGTLALMNVGPVLVPPPLVDPPRPSPVEARGDLAIWRWGRRRARRR